MFLVRVGVAIAMLALLAPEAYSEETHQDGPPVRAAITSVPRKPLRRPGPAITLAADINLTTQRMTIAVLGQPTHVWAISSGRSGYRTPTGAFKPQWTARMWHSRKYDMAPMPYSVFFKDGVAVHATSAIGMLGRPASHGCIRLAPANAAMFFNLVARHGKAATRIVVRGATPNAAPGLASRKRTATPKFARTAPRLPNGYTALPRGYSTLYPGTVYRPVTSPVRSAPRVIRYRQAAIPQRIVR